MAGKQISFLLLPFVLIAKSTVCCRFPLFSADKKVIDPAGNIRHTAQNPAGKQLFCILFTPRQLSELFCFHFVELN